MKPLRFILSMVLVTAMSAAVCAQGLPQSGTAPHQRGNAGWTGGSGEQGVTAHQPSASSDVSDQPWVASGVDLAGPPRRYPAGQTPE